MITESFCYRILLLEDDPMIQDLTQVMLMSEGYEVIAVNDGSKGLLALKRALPDIIISDLSMPHMNGFEFLSVVRRRFPTIPVIVQSAEFTARNLPQSVLADAFFPKAQYEPKELFDKIESLILDLPNRPRLHKPSQTAVWVKNDKDIVAVTCSQCLRTFPARYPHTGVNEIECEFCSSMIRYELIAEPLSPENKEAIVAVSSPVEDLPNPPGLRES